MLTSLDLLFIVFIGTIIVGFLALFLMFFPRNKTLNNIAFFFAAALGAVLGIINYLTTPGLYTGEIFIGWIFATVSVLAVLIELLSKNKNKYVISRILVIVSVLAGTWNAFVY